MTHSSVVREVCNEKLKLKLLKENSRCEIDVSVQSKRTKGTENISFRVSWAGKSNSVLGQAVITPHLFGDGWVVKLS